MYLQVPRYKYKFGSTYVYLRISISSITPTGDLNKYKSTISTSMCINLLYAFVNNYDICYCIFVTVICLLKMSISACVMYKSYVSH